MEEDQSKFIDSTTGELLFKTNRSNKNPSDNNKDNSYIVEIRADHENNNTFNKQVITVKSKDDTPPSIKGPSNHKGAKISNIFTKNPTKNIFTFSADEKVLWSLENLDDSDKFEINKDTGALSFKNPKLLQ